MVTAERPAPQMRIATPTDAAAIDALMKASTRELFPAYYTAEQTASSIVHIARVDPMLLEDGTYFVLEADGEIVACGGWSRRDKLYSGSADQEGRDRLLDPASEAAHVRAMFVRSDWTRRGLRHADPRCVRGGRPRRRLSTPVAGGDPAGLSALCAVRLCRGRPGDDHPP